MRDEPLAPRTTLRLGGAARYFAEVRSAGELREALSWAREARVKVALLGGGSNVVVPDEGVDGLVLRLAMRGTRDEGTREGRTLVHAEAGHDWGAFVSECVQRELAGVECLAGIPGSVGAVPVQNVGAYGQEVSHTIAAVRVLDRDTLQERELAPAECAFAYRDSAFKHGGARRRIVLGVTFGLTPDGAPTVRYAELARALEAKGTRPSLALVHDTVVELRKAKSMVLCDGDENARSAGSFFTNPVLTEPEARAVCERAVREGACAHVEDVPRFAGDNPGTVKLAAGWLIERAGVTKGTRRGSVGVSTKHALALVHHGGGTTRELLALADEVVETVRARFGVTLEREPVLLTATE